jgi:hypothetical protein
MSEGTAAHVLAGEATWCVLHGDSFHRLCELPENSCDAGVIDPPAGVSFMGKAWDSDKGGMREWIWWLATIMERTLRALKPGAHALAWALPRTSHWTGMALEYAGFEVRGQVQHWFGSGFPKSLNVSKAIDARLGIAPTVIGSRVLTGTAALSTEEKGGTFSAGVASNGHKKTVDVTEATSSEAQEWEGWGTALKPGHEVWWLVRKPLERGLTVAENVLKWGTGAINIDGCRVGTSKEVPASMPRSREVVGRTFFEGSEGREAGDGQDPNVGRWPPDIVFTHDARCRKIGTVTVPANPTWDTPNRDTEPSAFTGSKVSKVRHKNGRHGEASAEKRYSDKGSTDFAPLPGARRDDTETVEQWECVEGCPVRALSIQSGELSSGFMGAGTLRNTLTGYSGRMPHETARDTIADTGTAARFFPQFELTELDDISLFLYAPKPARSERDAGLQNFRPRSAGEATDREDETAALACPRSGAGRTGGARNTHATVKGQELLRYFTKLITPPRGVVLTPFAGSGSEGMAAISEGCRYIGIELNDSDEEPHVSIARARIHHVEGREFVPRESLRAPEPPRQRSLFQTGAR